MTNRLTSESRTSSSAPSLPRPPSAPVNAPEQMRHTSEVGNNDDDVVALASSPHARPDRRDTTCSHPLDVETISDANTPPQPEDRPKHNFWLENIHANDDNNNSNDATTNRLGVYSIKRNSGSNISQNCNASITATGALHDDDIFPIDMRKHGAHTNQSKIITSDPLDRQQRPLSPTEPQREQPSSLSSSGRRVRQPSHPSSMRRSTRSSVAAHLPPLNPQGQADSASSRIAAAALSQQEDAIQRDPSSPSSLPSRRLPAVPARDSSDNNALLPASPLVTPPITHEYILPQERTTKKSLRSTADESSSAAAAAATTSKAASAVDTSSSTVSPARRGVPHVYHDYSQLPDDYVAAESAGATEVAALLGATMTGRTTGFGPPLMAATATIRKKTGGVTTPFPEKLYDMLEAETPSDIVSWLPHGRAFIVRRPKDFTERIMPK